eukprot:COSAG02_NODE_35164_length_472_cov_3.581769_1_plen_48_part_10
MNSYRVDTAVDAGGVANCNLRLTSISRIPRLKTEMQPEFSQWGGQTPA